MRRSSARTSASPEPLTATVAACVFRSARSASPEPLSDTRSASAAPASAMSAEPSDLTSNARALMPSASMSPDPDASMPASFGTEASTTTLLPPQPSWSNAISSVPLCTSVRTSLITFSPAQTLTRCCSPTWSRTSTEPRLSMCVKEETSRVCVVRGPSSAKSQPATARAASAPAKRRRSERGEGMTPCSARRRAPAIEAPCGAVLGLSTLRVAFGRDWLTHAPHG